MTFFKRERAEEIATLLNDGESGLAAELMSLDSNVAFDPDLADDNNWQYHVEQRSDDKSYEIICYEPLFPREYGGRHMELARVGVI